MCLSPVAVLSSFCPCGEGMILGAERLLVTVSLLRQRSRRFHHPFVSLRPCLRFSRLPLFGGLCAWRNERELQQGEQDYL